MKRLLILLLFPLMMFAQDSTLIGDLNCDNIVDGLDAEILQSLIFQIQDVNELSEEYPCLNSNVTGLTPEQLQEMIDMMEDQLSINYTGGSGGGCNYTFPEGLDGEPITINLLSSSYTVPLGKNFYLTQGFVGGNGGNIKVDGEYAFHMNTSYIDGARGGAFIIKSGSIVESDESNANTFLTMSGFLVDQVIDPVSYTHLTLPTKA